MSDGALNKITLTSLDGKDIATGTDYRAFPPSGCPASVNTIMYLQIGMLLSSRV